MERKALQILKDGLESEGGAALIPSFSVKVKWGQHDLQGLGNIRKFLAKYPELFSLEGSTVTLSQSLLRKDEAPKTTSKSAPKAPPSSLGRRRLAEDIEEGQGSKMPRHAGAPTSKAWAVEVPNETNGTGLGRAKPDSTAPKASKGMAPKPKHTSAASAAASAISASAAPSGSAGSDVQDVEPAPWHSRRRIQAGSTGAGALKETTWEEDGLSDQELMHAITSSKARGMELELAELLKKLQPTEEYKRECQRALLLLRAAFAQEFPPTLTSKAPKLEIIGSCAQNTELNGSDVDVACRLSDLSGDELDTKLAKLWARLFSAPHSTHLLALDATRLFPHAPCQFSIHLKAAAPRFHAHLLLVGPQSGQGQESLDSMLRSLCDCCSKARDLIRLVKLWARNHGLMNHREGYMNGVAWTAFVLCFLQTEQYIPPLQTVLEEKKKRSEIPTASLRELLLRFFQYICAPQAKTPRGLSLMEGKDCEAAAPPPSHSGPPPPLYIQDPVQFRQGSDQNIAATLTEAPWARILDESRRVAERLDPSKPQRWFYWAEIFDPQGLASGAGGKRLPKLGDVKVPSDDQPVLLDGASSAVPATSTADATGRGRVEASRSENSCGAPAEAP